MGRSRAQEARELDDAYKVGFDEGLEKGRKEILDWLEHAYINDPGRPDRGSPKAEAILELARDASNHFRGIVKAKRRRR